MVFSIVLLPCCFKIQGEITFRFSRLFINNYNLKVKGAVQLTLLLAALILSFNCKFAASAFQLHFEIECHASLCTKCRLDDVDISFMLL